MFCQIFFFEYETDKFGSLLFRSVLAASGAGSLSDRSSTVISVKPL